jgi:uncharacterized membrane protein YecN with MAPEG domain
MEFNITVLFIALFAILQIPATFFVGVKRLGAKIYFGDGGDQAMLQRIRAHGNYTETVPISLLAMAAADYAGASDAVLWAGGFALLVGRVTHFLTIGLTDGVGPGRAAGMILTFLAMLLFAGSALIQLL